MVNPLDNLIPEDVLDDSSTPQNEWDEFWHLTHRNTKPIYEEVDDSDELDIDRLEYDEY